jgi:hypothetical protein
MDISQVPLRPIVPDRIGKVLSIVAKPNTGDRPAHVWEHLRARVCVHVPELESPVRATRGEDGVAGGKEGGGVDGEALGLLLGAVAALDGLRFIAMAFPCQVSGSASVISLVFDTLVYCLGGAEG